MVYNTFNFRYTHLIMNNSKNKALLRSSFIALFAAIISFGAFIRIPLGPVPIVFQNILCVFSGIVFGGIYAGAPTALFLTAGLIGLPVYSGGTGGLGVWAGPTGGFLLGYLLAAVLAGLIAGKPRVTEKQLSLKKNTTHFTRLFVRSSRNVHPRSSLVRTLGNGELQNCRGKQRSFLYPHNLPSSFYSRRFDQNRRVCSCGIKSPPSLCTIFAGKSGN